MISPLEKIGHFLGLAYQLRDDAIDIIGDPEFTGKPRAGDIRQRKMRLPMIHGLRNAGAERDKLVKLIRSEKKLTGPEVEYVIDLLCRTGSVDYTIEKTREYCQRAIEEAEKLPEEQSSLKENLRNVALLISSFQED